MATINISTIERYYNEFASKQQITGINARNKSIMKKSIQFGLKPHFDVLEIGCGIGTQTKLLIEFLKKGSLHSIDISSESIEIAKKKLGHFANLTIEVNNGTEFFINKKFNAIILPDVIEHIPIEYHGKMFQNLDNMLKNDGFILINIPNPFYLEWCQLFTPNLLQIIDQPIYTNTILSNIKNTNLYLYYEETYSIWVYEGDYKCIILKKKPIIFNRGSFNIIEQKANIIKKFKNLIRILIRKKFN